MTRFARSRLDTLFARADVQRIFAALDGDGEEVRIVGGALRNALVGREPGDVDFASTATPEVIRRRARKAGIRTIATGLEHGTLTLVVAGVPFEVTTLREDVETDGRRAKVRFGRDFEADARRRDFTINALTADAGGRIHDAVGGLDDLAGGRVRFIGDADQRIREDYLRILRFFRFSADYAEGPLDPEGFAASIRQREGLSLLSRERIRAELLKLMGTRRVVEVVGLLAEAGLWPRLTGGLVERGRLARAVAAGHGAIERLAAAALFVEEDAGRLRERLRLSNAETDLLTAQARAVARLRDRDSVSDTEAARALAVAFDPALLLRVLDLLAGEARPQVAAQARAVWSAMAEGRATRPVFPLRGADLVAAGLPRGPAVGEALSRAHTLWLASGCPEGEGVREDLLAKLAHAIRLPSGA